jgi:AcrR family transcriptional regulator
MPTRSALRVGRDITAEQRSDDVLRAALSCLAHQGYDNLRLRDIAREAEVSVGVLQHYFDSREQLLEQAFALAARDMWALWDDIMSRHDDPWARIAALLDGIFVRPQSVRHSARFLEHAAVASRNEQVRMAFLSTYDRWNILFHEAVAEGIENGTFAPALSVDDVVASILTSIDGCELAIAAHVPGMTSERSGELTRTLARHLLQYEGDD